jgi:hypothetical protein
MKNLIKYIALIIFLSLGTEVLAQIEDGAYTATAKMKTGTRNYLLLVKDGFAVHTIYDSTPNHFIETMGGPFTIEADSMKIALQFHSTAESKDSKEYGATFGYADGKLLFNGNEMLPYYKETPLNQDLDGLWLFATRGPDEGQERRGPNMGRKTLKILVNGYFQWIAYNSEDMAFRGSGGGRYAAQNGKYTEVIQFFSRDDSRVGAELSFDFERKGSDWHHTGNNSRGEPMYEIWALWE